MLLADEPTTALDATVQGQILGLLTRLQREQQLAMLLVTHDLGLVRRYADDVAIMYAGRVVEQAPSAQLLEAPAHPYTRALLACRPSAATPGTVLPTIPGVVPRPQNFVKGCRFAPRCDAALARCANEVPKPRQLAESQVAACWLHEETA